MCVCVCVCVYVCECVCTCEWWHVQGMREMKMLVGHMAPDSNPDAHANQLHETIAQEEMHDAGRGGNDGRMRSESRKYRFKEHTT